MVLVLVGLERFRAQRSAGQRRADEAVVRANLGERENRVRNEWVAREAESSLEPHGGKVVGRRSQHQTGIGRQDDGHG